MPDTIKLNGQALTFDTTFHSGDGATISLNFEVNGIHGYLEVFESTEEATEVMMEGLFTDSDGTTPEALFQSLIDNKEELELEEFPYFELNQEAFSDVVPQEMLISGRDEEHEYAMLALQPDGVLSWTLPEKEEEDEAAFRFQITEEASAANFGMAALNSKKGRSVFSIFRWIKKKVSKVLVKEPGFLKFLFDENLPKKKSWKKMDKDTDTDWNFLRPAVAPDKRALLLIHGFWGGPGNFYDFVKEESTRLKALYEDRIFIFNHPSFLRDIDENAAMFFEQWNGPKQLNLDVLTRSRGSLVFRQIAEQNPGNKWTDLQVQLGKVIMLAGPNEGTPLATPKNIKILLDVLTNILANTIGNLPVPGLKIIIHILKWSLKRNLQRNLRGVFSMDPGSNFVKNLNSLTGIDRSQYFALSVNAEPSNGRWKRTLDRFVDPIFNGIENDMVNPTHGVYGAMNTGDAFEISNKIINGDTENIHHLNYFKHATIRQQITTWLGEKSPNV